jgi:MFS family permease
VSESHSSGVPATSLAATVAVGFAVLTLSFGTRALIGLGMPTWGAEFAWSKTSLSAVGALALCVMALVVSFSGYLSDRWGARGILALGCGALTVALGLTAAMSQIWELGLGYGVAGGIGFGLASLPVVAAMVVRKATTGAGMATGIATAGATAGPLFMLPLMAWLFGLIGWRTSLVLMAALSLVGTFIVLLVIERGRPLASSTTTVSADSLFDRLKAFGRSREFHGLFWSFALCGFTTTGVVETHLIPFAELCGFGRLPSTAAYCTFAACNFAGMLGSGYLADRVDRRALLMAIYLVRAAAFVIPLFVGTNYTLLLAFSVAVGFAFYASFPATIGLSAAIFGREKVGSVMGILTVGHALGAAGGALASGYIVDLFQRYDWAWVLSIAVAAASAAFTLLLRDPRSEARVTKVGIVTA